ncbi:MAG: NAD(P)/FAD-dependent oxidoreductase, partial [Gammaproteobacteria bacterium]
RAAKNYLAQGKVIPINEHETVGAWLDRHGLGVAFKDEYLLPMAAAIWSCPTRTMLDYPAHSLLSFYENHGLLNVIDRPQWFTVPGGSREYVSRLAADIRAAQGEDALVTQAGIRCIHRQPGEAASAVLVERSDGSQEPFDAVVMATHPNEALELLAQPNDLERSILRRIRYQPNRVYLHSDAELMPKRQAVWSSWNYLRESGAEDEGSVFVSYWMNQLQGLPRMGPDGPRDWFVTLNPPRAPRDELVAHELHYDHPVLDTNAVQARRLLTGLQGMNHTWFAGAYFGSGFHEDGLRSALNVAHALGVLAPWEPAGDRPADLRAGSPAAVYPEPVKKAA